MKFDPDSGKLMILNQTKVTENPIRKLQKIDTPLKSVYFQIFQETQTKSSEVIDDISEQLYDTLLYSDSEFEEYDELEERDDLRDDFSNAGDNESVQRAIRRF